MPNLPPLPDEPISHADWIVLAIRTLYTSQGVLMSSISDLASAVSGLDAKVDALITAYNNAKNNPATHLDAADQAALDAAVAALSSESAAVEAANPPTPAPAPNPAPAPPAPPAPAPNPPAA